MKSQKKVFIEYEQQKVGSYYQTNVLMHLVFNKPYTRIKDIASEFGVTMPPRRGFVFLKDYELALCCINLDNSSSWLNQLDPNNGIIKEKKKAGETPEQFQKRIRDGHYYDVNLIRICFAKEKGRYRFVGAYKLSQVDFDNQTCVFKRVPDPLFVVSLSRREKITIVIEKEITEEITVIM